MKKKLTLLIALSILITLAVGVLGTITVKALAQPKIISEEEVVEEEEPPASSAEEAPPREEVREIALTKYEIPTNISTHFKTWMPYTAITNKASAQYKLQQLAYTDENGLRKINEDYCVAMGTFYSSTIGDRFKVTMSTGNTFTVIISDIKANKHTDKTNRYTLGSNCMMEFLIDKYKLNKEVRYSGNVGSLEMFSGTFISVEKINESEVSE